MKTQCEYANDGERITQPGKFEGEPVFAPALWSLGLDGFADSDDGKIYTFRINKDDKLHTEYPTLKKWLGRKRVVRLQEDSCGFVHCF